MTAQRRWQSWRLRRRREDAGDDLYAERLSKVREGPFPPPDLFLLATALLLSAFLMACVIGSPAFGWTAWISLFPIFLAIQILSPLWAGAAGAFWGLTLYVFSALVLGGGIAPSVRSVVLVTGIPAVYAFGAARFSRRLGVRPLLLALGWVGVELALTPLGLSEGLLAGSQGDSIQHYWISRSLGYVFIAFLIAGANALLLNILCEIHVRLPRHKSFTFKFTQTAFHIIPTFLPCRQWTCCRIQSRAPPSLGC
jgi:apolipoprotein N-acyltransferase